MEDDKTLKNLLDLDGIRMVIDEELGLWVKFDVSITSFSVRTNGIRYALSLHDQRGRRILGFDNAHDEHDEGRPYQYINAGQLVGDFWEEVEKRLNLLKGDEK